MKTVGSSRAKVEERQAKVLTLTLRGYSQTAIARELHVRQQIVSLDLKTVQPQITKIRDQQRIHTYQKAYARKMDMSCELWQMMKATKNIRVKLAIFDRIIKLDREIDRTFLANGTLCNESSQPHFAAKVIDEMKIDETSQTATGT